MPTETVFPVWQFWVCLVVLCGLTAEALRRWREPWTKPAVTVYGTVSVWYIVNYISDGPAMFKGVFGEGYVGFAFLQVAGFLLCYRYLSWLMGSILLKPARLVARPGPPLRLITVMVLLAWVALFSLGIVLSGWHFLAILWPPTSVEKISMFATAGIGSGDSFLINSCEYIYVLLCAWLGVLFVLEAGYWRGAVFAAILVSWPYYWFGWTRNRMLALLLPGMACYFLFKPGRWPQKIVAAVVVFSGVNLWFRVVANTRGESATQYLEVLNHTDTKELTHVGLNMFEELCWSDLLIDQNLYKANYGNNYFANAVNFIPRTFWPGKPFIGWDYAIARGVGVGRGESEGIYATISTGMIGQGVVNFGPYFGIVAAAGLMALWNCFLSHLWMQRRSPLRAMLFLVALGLTFNLGRDVTFLVLWPVVFGYAIVRVMETVFAPRLDDRARVRVSGVSRPAATTTATLPGKSSLPASSTS